MCLSADGWMTDDGWGRKTEFCINIHSKRPLFFPKRPSFFSKRPLIFSKRPPFLQSLRIPYKILRNLDKRRRCLYKYTVLCIFMHFCISKLTHPSADSLPAACKHLVARNLRRKLTDDGQKNKIKIHQAVRLKLL